MAIERSVYVIGNQSDGTMKIGISHNPALAIESVEANDLSLLDASKAETRMFSIRLPVDLIAELRRRAEESRRTVSAQTQIIIENGLKTPCPARRKS